jgi:hypothetical protein
MVSFKININFFYKFFIFFFFSILFNILFYIIIENIFLYSFVENINNNNYYISLFIFFFFFLLTFFYIFFYNKKKKTEIIITIFNFKFEKNLKMLIIITSIGIVTSFLFKLIPQFLFFLSTTKAEYQNVSCFLAQTKAYVFEKENVFINKNNFFFMLVNKLSWVFTVLLNFYYILIFFLVLFFKKLSNKNILISVILILISVSIYFAISGSKIILLSSTIILFTSMLFSYSLNLISLRRFFTIFLVIIFVVISIYSIAQKARISCINYKSDRDQEEYNSNIEFKRQFFFKKTNSNFAYTNYLRSLIHNNVTVNYSLFYLLSGKLTGDLIFYVDKNKNFNAGYFIYFKQVYNKMAVDIQKFGIKDIKYYEYDQNFLQRLNPIVSLYHMMFRDFAFLNLSILIFVFLLIFLQFLYFKNIFSLFIFIYSFLIFFYSVVAIGFANLLATFNTNIIFFNFFIFLFYFFFKSKIVIK